MRILFFLVIFVCSISACARVDVNPLMPNAPVLQRGEAVYITLPPNGGKAPNFTEAELIPGTAMQSQLAAVLRPYTQKIVIAQNDLVEKRTPALQSAKTAGAHYLLIPTIMYTSVDMRNFTSYLSVFDVTSGKQLGMYALHSSDGFFAPKPDEPNSFQKLMASVVKLLYEGK